MPYKDIEKRRECRRRWYKNNRTSEKQHIRRRKKEIRIWFANYKKKLKCLKCGESHPGCIDFHHKENENKDNEVTYFVGNGYSIKRILEEIKKCEVWCSNCHRKYHYINGLK